MFQDEKKGVSLIVLIITIIVMIILASSIVLAVSKNNPIESAKKSKFLSDVSTFKEELAMYELDKTSNALFLYDITELSANASSITEGGIKDTQKNITDVIPSMKKTDYVEKLEILNGELVYIGVSDKESEWLNGIIGIKNFNIDILATPYLKNISGSVELWGSLVNVNNISYCKIYLTDKKGEYSTEPNINSSAQVKTVPFDFDNLESNHDYYIKVEVKMANEENVRVQESGKITTKSDSTAPDAPIILVPMYSNKNQISPISITFKDNENGSGINKELCKYLIDNSSTNYTKDNSIWKGNVNSFNISEFSGNIVNMSAVVNSDGDYYLHVLSVDMAGNMNTATSSKTIVDKISPTATFGTNGGSNIKTASTTVTVSDSGSGVVASSLQYVWDTQNSTTPTSGWTSFTNGTTITKGGVTGTYHLWIKGSDNAGNSVVTKSNAFNIDNTAPTNPVITPSTTAWTNSNVTVTIVYPSDATIKEYSLDGTTWTSYTAVLSISTNNTTVYARGKDQAGNQSGTSTLTIANIDKISPTVAFGTSGGSNIQTASTTVTVSDTGGSTVNTSSLQYAWDTQNSTTPTNGWTTFANGATITKGSVTATYYLWIKASDNAGNSVVTKSNAFNIDNTAPAVPTIIPNTTAWTNSNVIVSITYPSDATTQEYSTNGTTWTAYTAPLVISANNTTVYARGKDAAGNQSGTSTLTIVNIDKEGPDVDFTRITKGISYDVTITDKGSGVNFSTLKYVWYFNGITRPTSGWIGFTYGNTIIGGNGGSIPYLWIMATDTLGNVTYKSNVCDIDTELPPEVLVGC